MKEEPTRKIDAKDREILRFLYEAKRPISGHKIAQTINITPPAIKPRLIRLQKEGLIKIEQKGETRTWKNIRTLRGKQISAPSKILWGIDLKEQ